MVVLFSMMNGKVEIPCAISTDALDSLEKSGHVKPDQRAAQFERLTKPNRGLRDPQVSDVGIRG
jgi:hypothetical protein